MLGKFTFWAFLLAARRSRRATGYAIASVRCTMRASTHALRMPNAKEVFFLWGFWEFSHPPAPKVERVKKHFFFYTRNACMYAYPREG
jgi:hypothetical protein